MRSGAKNAVVSIYEMIETVDPTYNTPIHTPQIWREDLFCVATPRRGRELAIDGQVSAETYMKFDFEYFDVEGITEQMFIVHETVGFDIKGILPDLTTKQWIVVDAVSRKTPTGRETT